MTSYQGMREVERYQLKIAEKHYLKKEYKIAMDEYEKFLSLYEESTGAPYGQLMWSQCLLKLRKVNTAIREGFQSVVDYWPDSEEAKTAAYLIARSYQDMGEIEKAKASYKVVMENYPDGNLAVLSRASLLEIAKTAEDEETVLSLLEELTYRTKRNDASRESCERASRELAHFYLRKGNSAEAIKSLATSYKDNRLDQYLYEYGSESIRHLGRTADTKELAARLGSFLVAHFEKSMPASLVEPADQTAARDSLSRMAGIYSNLGESDKVLKTYERSGKLLGITDGLLGQIASHYRSMGEREKAKQTYLRYENAASGKNAIAYMFREEKKYDDAIKLYRELTQEHAEGINNYLWSIAECYEGKQDWKNAIQTYRQTDRFPVNYIRMAACHRRLKQWNEALSLYNQSKSSDRYAPEAAYLIGHTYEDAGQRENAIKAFQLTCRTYPKSSYASRAHAHLQTKYNITATFGGAKDE